MPLLIIREKHARVRLRLRKVEMNTVNNYKGKKIRINRFINYKRKVNKNANKIPIYCIINECELSIDDLRKHNL